MTAEVRLVAADELRRRIEAVSCVGSEPWERGYRTGRGNALNILRSMPSVTAPKGWTRDEVLAELAKHPDNVCEWLDPFTGKWFPCPLIRAQSWHPEVRRFDVRVVRSTPDPEWVPLTKLVGRTIHGETEPVDRIEWATKAGTAECRARWRWHERGCLYWQDFPDGTLNLDDATVAVRPEAAT